MTDLETSPGVVPPRLIISSRSARPSVALARLPGPSMPRPELMPRRSRTGPLTIVTGAEGAVVVAMPLRLNSGTAAASTIAASTGMCSGTQPGKTAVAASAAAGGGRLAGPRAVARRQHAEPLLRCALEPVQHPRHARLGGGEDRQPVGPPSRVHEVEGLGR